MTKGSVTPEKMDVLEFHSSQNVSPDSSHMESMQVGDFDSCLSRSFRGHRDRVTLLGLSTVSGGVHSAPRQQVYPATLFGIFAFPLFVSTISCVSPKIARLCNALVLVGVFHVADRHVMLDLSCLANPIPFWNSGAVHA